MELNKIYNEDCLMTMSKMPNGFVDYVVTSPPYNMGVTTQGKSKYNEYTDDLDDYFAWSVKVIDGLLRVTKNHVFYNIQMLGGNKLDFLKLIGHYSDKIKDIMIWNKKMIPHIQKGVICSQFEFIIIFSNQNPEKKMFNDGNFKGNFSNVYSIMNKHHNEFSKEHRAVFPLDLPRTFMQKFGNENDIWFDPFTGSGTTQVAAILEKRKWIGSELSETYFNLANKRLEKHLQQTTLF